MSQSSNLLELIKVSGVLTSVISTGFGAYRLIRNDISESEKRLRDDFRADVSAIRSDLIKQHAECLSHIEYLSTRPPASLAKI